MSQRVNADFSIQVYIGCADVVYIVVIEEQSNYYYPTRLSELK